MKQLLLYKWGTVKEEKLEKPVVKWRKIYRYMLASGSI